MDSTTRTEQHDKPAYTTSKQVQAWFLGRSRDRWKKKYAELKAEAKRLQQHVTDVSKSRAGWRREADAARRRGTKLSGPARRTPGSTRRPRPGPPKK